MTDTGTDSPRNSGLAGDLREAAAVQLSVAPTAAQVRRRGDRRRTASRAATVTAALALLGGTATAGVYVGQSAFDQEGRVAPPAATAGPSPSPSSSTEETPGVEFHVTVDLARHRLTVYSGDYVARVIPITAGNAEGGSPTPEGRFRVTEKEPVRQRSDVAGQSGEDTYQWYIGLDEPGIFLAVPYWDTEDENDDWVYGSSNVTGGWIGLDREEAKWLYRKLEVGDTVTIRASGT